jgi:hypothetical protein
MANKEKDPMTNHTTDSDGIDGLDEFIARSGLTREAVLEHLEKESGRPFVRDHVESYLGHRTENTRRGYATHLNRLLNGFGPICDQTCEPCLDSKSANPFSCR